MKYSSIIISLSFVLLYFSSCCSNEKCEPVFAKSILFFNFQYSEVDTIAVLSYEKNTNFSTPKDSLIFMPYYLSGTKNNFAVNVIDNFNPNFDYKISLFKAQKEYFITNLVIEKKSCGRCFPKKIDKQQYEIIKEYYLNGTIKRGSTIEIFN